MNECEFGLAWVGRCREPSEGSYCDKHSKEVCCSCGKQASHQCDETGQFVCGSPLCDHCEHTIFPNGTNGGIGFNQAPLPPGMKRHCRKSEQKYDPWHVQEAKKEATPKQQSRMDRFGEAVDLLRSKFSDLKFKVQLPSGEIEARSGDFSFVLAEDGYFEFHSEVPHIEDYSGGFSRLPRRPTGDPEMLLDALQTACRILDVVPPNSDSVREALGVVV